MADHCSIVPHPTEPRVLVAAEGERWTLPRHETEDAEAIRDLMRQRYGLAVTVSACTLGHYDAADVEHDEPVFIFALETHGGRMRAMPDGSRWIGRDDLATVLADAEQRQALERWFAEAESGDIPAERAPLGASWLVCAKRRKWIEPAAPSVWLATDRSYRPAARAGLVIGAAAADNGRQLSISRR